MPRSVAKWRAIARNARMNRFVLGVGVLMLCACEPRLRGGPNCLALQTGTPREQLPFSAEPGAIPEQQWNPLVLIAATPELSCCVSSPSRVDKPAAEVCAAVDCDELLGTLAYGRLNKPYAEACEYPDGDFCQCWAIVDDSKVVGVLARWDD